MQPAQFGQLVCSDTLVQHLIERFPGTASLKEAREGKYLIGNSVFAEVFGLDTHACLAGRRIQDLSSNQVPLDCQRQYQEWIVKLDASTRTFHTPVCKTLIGYRHEGALRVVDIYKLPLLGLQGKTLAILSFGLDKTSQVNLNTLFNYYQKFYPVKQAVSQFLQALRIADCFLESPTSAEVRTLLVMVEERARKYVSACRGLSPKTIDIHIENLRSKLQHTHLHGLLVQLRRAPRGLHAV